MPSGRHQPKKAHKVLEGRDGKVTGHGEAITKRQRKKSPSISVGATFMVARRGSPDDVGLSLNGPQPHPRATMKVAPTESWIGAAFMAANVASH